MQIIETVLDFSFTRDDLVLFQKGVNMLNTLAYDANKKISKNLRKSVSKFIEGASRMIALHSNY